MYFLFVRYLWLLTVFSRTLAFCAIESRHRKAACLFALGKAQNKQAELARKLQLAKKQQGQGDDDASTPQDVDVKRRLEQERSEFAQLLAKNIPPPETKEKIFTRQESVPAAKPTTVSKPKQPAKRRKKAVDAPDMAKAEEDQSLQEGDIAKRRHFEPLVSVSTKQPLGPMAAAQLVPWVPPYLSRYLVVLADPRKQSSELRSVLQFLTSSTAPSVLSNTIAITVDAPEETTAWLRRVGMTNGPIRIFSDVKLEWMKTYASDKGRWSLCLYAIDADGVIKKLVREVDPAQVSRLVSEVVQSMEYK